MKRISLFIIPLSLFIAGCPTEQSPTVGVKPSTTSLYPEPIVLPNATERFDLTSTPDARIEFAGSSFHTLTPVLTAEGLNLIPSAVLVDVQKASTISSIRFDRFDPLGDIIRSTFHFVVNNAEAESFPEITLANYAKTETEKYNSLVAFPLFETFSNSGAINKQVIEHVEPNESLQFEVRVATGEKSTVAANVNDIVMTELLVESYQTTDDDWNNATYSIDQTEFCSFDPQDITTNFSLDSQAGTKTIDYSILLAGIEIAHISTVLEPGETQFDGYTSVMSEAYQGTYPYYVEFHNGNFLNVGLNLDNCHFNSYIHHDLLDNIADDEYQTELQMNFKAISELDSSTQAWSKLSTDNQVQSTDKGLQLYPQGFDLLKFSLDQRAIILPEPLIAPETQIMRFRVQGFVGDIDVDACERQYLSMSPFINGDLSNVMLYALTEQAALDHSLLLFVNDYNADIQMQVDFDARDCQPNVDTAKTELYLTQVDVEQYAFETHPLTQHWNVQLEASGEACEAKTIDSDIRLDLSTEGSTISLNDGSELWVQLTEQGNITWSWDVDGSTESTQDGFFYGHFLWSTMTGEQGCLKRLSLYRDNSWLVAP